MRCAVSCAKTAELIEMPFGLWAQVGSLSPYNNWAEIVTTE